VRLREGAALRASIADWESVKTVKKEVTGATERAYSMASSSAA
jgi:hypothetical protein